MSNATGKELSEEGTDPFPEKPQDASIDELKAEIDDATFVDPDPVTSAEVFATEGIAPPAPAPEQRILDAIEMIRQRLPANAGKEIQEDVVRLVSLMEPLQLARHTETRMAELELALHWLLASSRQGGDDLDNVAGGAPRVDASEVSHQVVLAKKLTENLEKKLGSRFHRWWNRFRNATPPHVDVVLGLGLITLLLVTALVILILSGVSPAEALGVSQTTGGSTSATPRIINAFIWLGAVGAFGSIVSILTRLRDIAEEVQEKTKVFLFFMTGLFKPVIGFATANLAYVLIKSQLIPLTFDDEHAVYAFVGIAFVSGFSERLVQDLVSITERAVGAAGERGVEAQRVAQEKEEETRREIETALSGQTEISRADIYAFDIGEPAETVTAQWDKKQDSES